MTRIVCFLGMALVLCGWTAAAAEKVTLCHAPPDNPTNTRELVVDIRAARAHLNQHPDDVLGPCRECREDGDCDDGVCDEATGECVPQVVCPLDPPEPLAPCTGSGSCAYGEECCCGECFPSYVCECVDGAFACFATDACLLPPCEQP